MKIISAFCLAMTTLSLSACGDFKQSPYVAGKSASDIPAHINVVAINQAVMMDGIKNGEPQPEIDPSQNDKEVSEVFRRALVGQFTSFGYKPVDAGQPADIGVRFFISYIPERWPLVGRTVIINGILDGEDGKAICKISSMSQNTTGLIGAVGGDSRDQMVVSATREAVIKLVKELQKGAKENISVQTSVPVVAQPITNGVSRSSTVPVSSALPATIIAPAPVFSAPPATSH